MPTMKQKVDRIETARQNIITSINNKGVTVASDAGIETLSSKVDDIQQGGGSENKFLQLTDLSYLFYRRDLSDEKILDGLKRYAQNNVTAINDTFYYAKIYGVSQSLEDEILGYIERICSRATLTNCNYAFYHLDVGYRYSSPQQKPLLDLSNMTINGTAERMFYEFGTGSQNRYIKLKLNKNTFKNCTSIEYLFAGSANGVTIALDENKLDFSSASSLNYIMSTNCDVGFEDYSGNQIKDIYIVLKPNAVGSVHTTNAFVGFKNFERVRFENCNAMRSCNETFRDCTNLKSLHGLDFSGINNNLYPFGNLYANKLTNFGEFEIVNGSTLGSVNNTNLILCTIWNASKDTVRDGQTIEYWYEKFANALGNKAATGTQTITINTTLYNSLTQAQKELITDKGYTLAYAS